MFDQFEIVIWDIFSSYSCFRLAFFTIGRTSLQVDSHEKFVQTFWEELLLSCLLITDVLLILKLSYIFIFECYWMNGGCCHGPR